MCGAKRGKAALWAFLHLHTITCTCRLLLSSAFCTTAWRYCGGRDIDNYTEREPHLQKGRPVVTITAVLVLEQWPLSRTRCALLLCGENDSIPHHLPQGTLAETFMPWIWPKIWQGKLASLQSPAGPLKCSWFWPAAVSLLYGISELIRIPLDAANQLLQS